MNRISKILSYILFLTISLLSYGQTKADEVAAANEASAQQYLTEGNKAEAARLYNQTAYEYRINGNYAKSISYYEKVLALNTELNNKMGQILTHTNLSMLYIETEQYENALKHLKVELEYRKQKNNPKEVIPVIISIAGVKNELERYEEAAADAQTAIDKSQEIDDLPLIKRSYGIMFDIHTKWDKQELAQQYFGMYSAIDKKLKELRMAEVQSEAKAQVNEANLEKAKTQQALSVTSEKLEKTVVSLEEAERIARQQQMELDLQQALINEQQALLRLEKMRKTYFAAAFIVTLVFVVVLIFLILRIRKANIEINEQKQKLEKQNKEIRSSINYAETIQNAMLPDLDTINDFASPFMIYRPKDIVSGDFYWAKIESEERMYFAVVDCTGHGVPGAFMSMIGMRILNEIVNEMKIESPALILENLNNLIREALRQEQTDNNDGMDLVLVRVDKLPNDGYDITYSGAKRPLYIGRKSSGMLEILQPDRKSIGGNQPTKRYIEFTDQKVQVEKGDVLYMFSDGITDQNDTNRKKFGRTRLEKLLKANLENNAEQQCEIIEGKLDEFAQQTAQRDDITFSGLILR